jgi:hypothetical protein
MEYTLKYSWVHTPVSSVPGGHVVGQAAHAVLLIAAVRYLPLVHAVHVLLVVLEHVLVQNWPAKHVSTQETHGPEPLASLNVLAGQVSHMALEVAVHAADNSCVPAGQVPRHAAHAALEVTLLNLPAEHWVQLLSAVRVLHVVSLSVPMGQVVVQGLQGETRSPGA